MSRIADENYSRKNARPPRDGSRSFTDASPAELSHALKTSLLLESSPVGVRLFSSADEFITCGFPTPQVPLHYCSAVRMAGEGSSLKLAREDMSCDTAPRTLGLEPGFLDDDFVEGYVTAGLYSSHEQAAEILADVAVLSDVVGVALGPLESFGSVLPDVVVISTLPYSAMRLTQAATYGGTRVRSNNIGMHGVCSECTAAPVTTGQVCTSLLCSGTRHLAGWEDELVSIGIPMELIPQIVDALMSTVERYETDERKAEMQSACSCAAPPPRVAEVLASLSDKAGYFYED